ncbi:COX15/CtaA family protein [Phenylobacterium sp. 20VBR1]|uniref:Heme A synthase n=1 Tax=Phenylobacterium glaciei TaxID=2803784 RepID=A0A941HWG6_9CAUL|nr:COX15/CtaA family protein [Phenylobacterium glaciei]MBR7620071.1 COX15/CtaA family protein [Phenylobacterium glaciei]
MTSFLRSDRSRPVAIWLFAVALLVLAMVVVGGATRLTDSGLSITQWKPVSGALPPMSAGDWNEEFARYREIPQYIQLNKGMSLGAFKAIYWWEWGHRLLGRLVGAAFAVPFAYFLIRRQIPKRLIWRCAVLFGLGGLQGLVGWWMVASGLSDRVSVAPERLTMHLGLAFALLAGLVWTGLDAWTGAPRQTVPSAWNWRALGLAALIYVQILLGALVAGNDAGLVYNDWPLMNGALFPADYAGASLWATLAHSQAAVQFHHRIMAYLLLILTLIVAVGAQRSRYLPAGAKVLALVLGGTVLVQAGLGIATLMAGVPLWLGLLHQITAALLLAFATAFAWRVRRP